ncbi:MAG TPA: hypothetical protein ACFCUD_14870 [Cyclobacteriaceae bacterium]
MVWQKTGHPVQLDTPGLFDQKAEYVIMNPVSSSYVSDETAWKYSSAGRLSPLKLTEAGGIQSA